MTPAPKHPSADQDLIDTTSSAGPEPHILIVDDDPQLSQLVAKFLRGHGYRVTSARDGREMLAKLAAAAIDLIVLDLMLPAVSGLDLCRELRRSSSIPIIMLSAKDQETDRIVGLEMGADDYLSKPFSSRELLARIRALLRRAQAGANPLQPITWTKYGFDGWLLDPLRRELSNGAGVVIDLSTGEYDMLLAFVEAPQRVLTREQLLDASRHRIATGFDRSIDVQISRLRRKIDTPEADSRIKTIRGAGYMFMPQVTRH